MIKTMNHQKEIEERISLNKLTNNEECKSVSTVSTFMPKLKRYCALFQPICERKIQQTIDDSVDEIGMNIFSEIVKKIKKKKCVNFRWIIWRC